MEGDAFVKLLGNGGYTTAVGWIEGLIGAESASPCAKMTVTIRAGEARIDRKLLNPRPESLAEIVGIGVVKHGAKIRKKYNKTAYLAF
jgi:hypothetical protein